MAACPPPSSSPHPQVNTVNNPLTIALQVEWLRRCLLGRLRLPSCEDMITDVKAMMRCGGGLAGWLATC